MSARWTSADLAARGQKLNNPKGQKAESANRITTNIIRVVNMQSGCAAYRINNVGIWDEKKQIRRKGNTQKGIGDISAIIRGRALWIEVKAGRDKLSQDQMIFRQEVERAGGLYFEARSTDEFLEYFEKLLGETKT